MRQGEKGKKDNPGVVMSDRDNEPESSVDPRIDSAAMTENLLILQGLLSGLPMSLWSAVPDID